MAKKKSVSSLKKALDRVFSEYIRRRNADANGYVTCCSCGTKDHWRNMDAGHFVSRKHNSTRYHEDNVNPQCRRCNRYDEGNKSGYVQYYQCTYGWDIVQELHELGHQAKQFKPSELLEMLHEYKTKLKALPKLPEMTP